MSPSSPESNYRKEKARRVASVPHNTLMEEAKAAFQQQIENGRLNRRGRPKKVTPPAPAEPAESEEG